MSTIIRDLGIFVLYAVIAVFAQNAIFTRSLGVSRLLSLVKDPTLDTVIFGALLAAVQAIAAPLGWLAVTYVAPLFSGDLRAAVRPLLYMLCSAAALGIVYLVIHYLIKPARGAEMVQLLPLATFNCCVLGTLLITGGQRYTLPQSLGFALGTAIGYLGAVLLVTEAQRKLQNRFVPVAFRGLPVTLVYIGILSLAIYSATGHMLSV